MGYEMTRVMKDPEERRKELIDAAERLFIAEGYDQTAISDIVREVNVSQGAFYYYFNSKEDVLVAALEKELAIMEGDLNQIAGDKDLDEAVLLNLMINRFISISSSGKKILGYLHQTKNATLHKKLMRERPFSSVAPIMAEVISRGCEKGRFNVLRPLETSYLLLMLIASSHHLFYQDRHFDDLRDLDQMDKNFLENVRAALEDLLSTVLGVSDYKFILQI
jgi:AcrR family transcriptional regulator